VTMPLTHPTTTVTHPTGATPAADRDGAAVPPPLRILRARPCEPRYDDELPESARAAPATDGALALTLPVGDTRQRERRLRLLAPPPDDEPPGDLPPLPARPWLGRLVQAVNEVLGGERPLSQLAPHLSPEVYAGLDRSLNRDGRPPGGRRPPAIPAVRALRVCEPRPGVAEVAAVVRHGARMRALALRLEAGDGRWRCTVLQVG